MLLPNQTLEEISPQLLSPAKASLTLHCLKDVGDDVAIWKGQDVLQYKVPLGEQQGSNRTQLLDEAKRNFLEAAQKLLAPVLEGCGTDLLCKHVFWEMQKKASLLKPKFYFCSFLQSICGNEEKKLILLYDANSTCCPAWCQYIIDQIANIDSYPMLLGCIWICYQDEYISSNHCNKDPKQKPNLCPGSKALFL